MLGFLGRLAVSLEELQSVAVWELCLGLTDVYNTGRTRFWYLSIDILCILLHVKFEGGLPISVLKYRTLLFQKSGIKTVEFSESSQSCQTPWTIVKLAYKFQHHVPSSPVYFHDYILKVYVPTVTDYVLGNPEDDSATIIKRTHSLL